MLAERALSQDSRPRLMGAARPVDQGPRDRKSARRRGPPCANEPAELALAVGAAAAQPCGSLSGRGEWQ